MLKVEMYSYRNFVYRIILITPSSVTSKYICIYVYLYMFRLVSNHLQKAMNNMKRTHSCGKISWHHVLFVHSWCTASEHIADSVDQNGMCQWGSFQRQGSEWFAFVISGKKEPPRVVLLYLEIAWDHFIITKVADVINLIHGRVVLEGSLQWNKRC
jgi:hypothetical protein